MSDVIDHTRLHRTAKYFMDNGRADSPEKAMALLKGFALTIATAPSIADDVSEQIALLTLINTARRTFLGGVEVCGLPDAPLRVPLVSADTLKGAAIELGGRLTDAPRPGVPLALIGEADVSVSNAPSWRLQWAGWRGGVVPVRQAARSTNTAAISLAPALAAAACVAEVFAALAGDHPMAGNRSAGLSLWSPGRDWLVHDPSEPSLTLLPSRLWLIGLGNLGQAFSWLLAALPYRDTSKTELMLQDIDSIAVSNDSTSLLSSPSVVGIKKTRLLADWLGARGFSTAIDERWFGECTRRAPHEPGVALCGVDNALARLALDKAGFDIVVEMGLGAGPDGFRNFSLHSFPSSLQPQRIWSKFVDASEPDMSSMPAYDGLRKKGIDACGLAQLASRTVGVPFVGLTAAILAMAELLRRLHGGAAFEVISGSMMCLDDIDAVAMETPPYIGGHVGC